ncbi:MAG: hypothetical protein QM709_00690 [Spongiibacteraceae bacterium]
MPRALFFFAPLFFVVSGCQQAAWKAGASADDFKRDELACRTATSNDDAVSQCLRDKGWSLATFAAPADDNALSTPNTATADSEPSPLTESVRSTPEAIAHPPAATKTGDNELSNPKAVAPVDPLQRQSVQTWWKAGAQAADFQIDAERCLTQLGEPHTPDYANHLYTRAMIKCLRESGWYAGKDPVYTPLR